MLELALAAVMPPAMPQRVRALLLAAHFKRPALLHWLRVTATAAGVLAQAQGAFALLADACMCCATRWRPPHRTLQQLFSDAASWALLDF
jgi:hypothetical protein